MSWIRQNTPSVIGWLIMIMGLAYTLGVTAEGTKYRLTAVEKEVVEIKAEVKEIQTTMHKLDKLIVRLEAAVTKVEE